ncbi:MAG: arsenite methyltransferase [Pirellulales bacterium]
MSLEKIVQQKYGQAAQAGLSSERADVRSVAEAFGYSSRELSSIPAEANLGLSCGNPSAFASLRPGEVVVDLGSGGGIDVFLAAQKVGPTGRAIGIDMTPAMVDLARRNAAKLGAAAGAVEFHLSTIDNLPLPDASVDCIISNCVVNLAPDKPKVFREMGRVAKPGGRVAISDIALKRPLPAEVAENLLAYVGCVAGAIPVAEYEAGLAAAGFTAIEVHDTGADLNAYSQIEGQGGCCSPNPAPGSLPVVSGGGCCSSAAAATSAVHADLKDLLSRYDINEYAASVRIQAVRGPATVEA